MPPVFKKKIVWIPALCALLLAAYALAGFVWAPKLLRDALLKGIRDNTGLQASVGEIRINPFLLQLEIKDFSLPDAKDSALLGFQRLFVDFEASSLWHRAYVFQDIEIGGPYANAVISPRGLLNFAALKPKSTAPAQAPPVSQEASLPSIQVASFSVTQGAASYEDRSRADPIALKLDPITFELKDFTTGVTTGAEGGRFKFTGASKLGERLQWQGHFSLQPLSSDGQFQIDALHAHTLWNYVKQQVAFFVPSGTIDLNGAYTFALRAQPELQLKLAQVSLKDLAIRPAESGPDWITVPQLTVTGTSLDLSKHAVHVESINIDRAKVVAWMEPGGALNLQQLAKPARMSPAAAVDTPSAVPVKPVVTPTPPPSAWTVQLSEFTLHEAALSMQDRSTTPAASFELAPMNLRVGDISQDLSKPLALQFDTGINAKGKLTLNGSVRPAPLLADLKVGLTGFQLEAIQPYLSQHTALTLSDGDLNVEGQLQVEPPSDAAPAARRAGKRSAENKPMLQFAGDVSVDRLHTVDNLLRQDLVKWNRVQIKGIHFSHAPDRLDVEQIIANRLYARVLVEPDRTLNVAQVLAGPKGLPPPSSESPSDETAAGAAAAKLVASRRTPVRNSKKAVVAVAAPAPTPATPMMPLSIKKIVLQASSANFSDLSLKPNFSASIVALEGSVTGLSSKPNSRAKIDLHGQVDRFSPVAIQGEVNVFSSVLYTDVSMSFRNMELTTFNPYSGKFAGYNISKGKLTTELSYKIDGRKLNAGHHIIIDQLEFGEKTASKDAVSLPVKLAVALLKDRNGVIDLDVPVTGSLDDPHFRLGPIIWKVVLNLLVKIVTSPFALLGSMFGGGPDLQYVDFPAGLGALDEAGQNRVKTIAKALAERPQLKIAVPLAGVPDLDRPALLDSKLHSLLLEQQRAQNPRKKDAAMQPPAFDTLPPPAQLELLAAVYKKQTGGAAKFPTPAEAAAAPDVPAPSKADLKAQQLTLNIDFLRTELLKTIQVDDAEVQALAQARASAIQQVLLTDTQIDPARVFLVANNKAKAQANAVRLELTLE